MAVGMGGTASGGAFDFAPYFDWPVIGPIQVDAAQRRILAYCTEPKSGWGIYDLARRIARDEGALERVTSWSLLLANALNGQVSLSNVADFTLERRVLFARCITRVPDVDLITMDNEEVERVVDVCCFGFPGVWGPKTTKLAALYRPRSVPVLDGHVALAFGFSREGFSNAALEHGLDRRARIQHAVNAFRHALADHSATIAMLRASVCPAVPEIEALADLRLLDMVIWTSQDDLISRRGSPLNRWLNGKQRSHIPLENFHSVPFE